MITDDLDFLKYRINQSYAFYSMDSEERYKENLKKFGPGWYYAGKEFTYRYNSHGYRSPELEYFDDKKYILVLGCSHTDGIGLPQSEIYHTHVSTKLRMPVLNCGVSGSSPFYQLIHTNKLLKRLTNKPSLVIVQWPEWSRSLFMGQSLGWSHLLASMTNPNKVVDRISKLYIYDGNAEAQSEVAIEAVRNIWQLANVPYIDFTFASKPKSTRIDVPFFLNDDFDDMSKRARDGSHFGPDCHSNLAQILLKQLSGIDFNA